jgi:hypothetical protein
MKLYDTFIGDALISKFMCPVLKGSNIIDGESKD